jgi:RNA polymerase sigma factor (sigma-70 family)
MKTRSILRRICTPARAKGGDSSAPLSTSSARPSPPSPLATRRTPEQYPKPRPERAELDAVLEHLGAPGELFGVRPIIRLLGQFLAVIDAAARSEESLRNARIKRSKLNMDLDRAIRTLPPRQRDVLDGLKAGLSEKDIAARLQISTHTVHVYVKALYRRFEVSTRAELMALWLTN